MLKHRASPQLRAPSPIQWRQTWLSHNANGPWFFFVGGDSRVTQSINAVPPMNPHLRAVFKDNFFHQILQTGAGDGTAALHVCCRTGLVLCGHCVQELPVGREHLLSMLGKQRQTHCLCSAPRAKPRCPPSPQQDAGTAPSPCTTLCFAHLCAPSVPCILLAPGPADAVHSPELLCTAREEQEVPPSSHLGWVWGGFLLYPLPGGGAAAGPAEKLGGGYLPPPPAQPWGWVTARQRKGMQLGLQGGRLQRAEREQEGWGRGCRGWRPPGRVPLFPPPCPSHVSPFAAPQQNCSAPRCGQSFNYCCW